MSLRTRLLAGMGFIAGVLVVVFVLITVTTRNQLVAQLDARLEAFAPGGRGGERPQDDGRPPQDPGGAPERKSDSYQGFFGDDGELTTVFTPNVGTTDPGTPVVTAEDLPPSGSSFFTTESTNGVTYRVHAQRFDDGWTITALPMDAVEDTVRRLVTFEVASALVILAVLALVSWWVLRLGIRPVRRMTDAATQIAEGDLAVRVPEGAPGTESGDLAVALNRMLGRIEDAVDERAASEERLRRFVADASHELRTPITTIRGYAELYRHGGLSEPDSLDDAMRRTEQEASRMGRLVEDMLLLAKLDEQRALDATPVDLAALARDAAADARAAAPERTIAVEADGVAIVSGDEDRLRQIVANVVGNALVHTDPDVPITVRVLHGDGAVSLEVEDRGEGMAPEVAERVTERFFRADPARSRHRGGSGLGLSIVEATMEAHGGSVAIDSEPGVGTTVRLTLPVDEADG